MVVPCILNPSELSPDEVAFATQAFVFPGSTESLLCLPHQMRTCLHDTLYVSNVGEHFLAGFKAWQAQLQVQEENHYKLK